jgi:hypothetical protein
MKVEVGSTWSDRGTTVVVESVAEDGAAVVRLPSGERIPVTVSFFARALEVEQHSQASEQVGR